MLQLRDTYLSTWSSNGRQSWQKFAQGSCTCSRKFRSRSSPRISHIMYWDKTCRKGLRNVATVAQHCHSKGLQFIALRPPFADIHNLQQPMKLVVATGVPSKCTTRLPTCKRINKRTLQVEDTKGRETNNNQYQQNIINKEGIDSTRLFKIDELQTLSQKCNEFKLAVVAPRKSLDQPCFA